MGPLLSWIRASGGWVRSPFGDLPALRADDSAAHQTWLILAGGIALILSRASQSELASRFVAARQVHAIARARLHKRRLPKPDPALLRDALQEIANLADPMTREAGRECLDRCVERLAAKAARGAGGVPPTSTAASTSSAVAGSTQALSTQAASTCAATVQEHEPTRVDLDLLFERSNKLRGTVAWARSTTFGPDA